MIDRIEILKKARAAKGPLSPVETGLVKMRKALLWVYRWGWSSSKILEIVGGAQRSGLAARLVKRGFLKSTKTESGGYAGGPAALLTLTEPGLAEVEKHIDDDADLLEYELNAYKIDQTKIRHDELAQLATARMLKDGSVVDYTTEAMAAAKSQNLVKQHDIVWTLKDGTRRGIEVELSAKWQRKLDQFVLSCLLSIKDKRVDEVCIVTDAKAIRKRYTEAFTPGTKFGKWEKNDRGFWTLAGSHSVPDYADKVICLLLE